MKFKDIKKLPFATYKVNVPWTSLENTLEKYDESHTLILDPPYQRGYVWTEEQKIKYVEYILRGGFSGKDIFFNSPNWMNWSRKNSIKPIELVDGKQRIEAVLSFLNNKIKAYGYYLKEYEDNLGLFEAEFVFHINKLSDPVEVVEWYLGMNDGGTAHTEKDLKVAYDYLETLKGEIDEK